MLQYLRPALFAFVLVFSSLFSFSADRYWVGGSGDWNDTQHWSNTNGGNGGASVPDNSDNVFFNGNSGLDNSSVITVSQNESCNNFYSGTPVNFITSLGKTISVYGNFELGQYSKVNSNAKIVFTGNGSKEINLGDNQIDTNLEFDGSGTWELTNNLGLTKYNSIRFIKGTINTNGKHLFLGEFNSLGTSSKELNSSNSIFYVDKRWELSDVNFNSVGETIYLNENIDQNDVIKGGAGNANYQYRATCAQPSGPPVTADLVVTSSFSGAHISCNGECDAEVTVSASSAGGGPFSYSFAPPSAFTSQTVYTGLCAGTYTVIVKDSSNQIFPGIYADCPVDVQVVEPALITASYLPISAPTCPGDCNGVGFISSVGGGTGTLDVTWSNGDVGTVSSNLCTGPNAFLVEDDNGCSLSDTALILDPPVIQPNLTVADVSCFGDCDGEIVSNPTGGNGTPYTFAWDIQPTNTSNTAPNLCQGPVQLTVTDTLGCTETITVTIDEPLELIINTLPPVDVTCFGQCTGELEVITTNGQGTITFQWFDNNTGLPIGQTNALATGLCAGDYYVEVTDDFCTVQSPVMTITQPLEITGSVINTDVLCSGDCNATAETTSLSGGDGNYTLTWFNNLGPAQVGAVNADPVGGLCAGTYFLQIEDGTGCTVQLDTFVVAEPTEVTATGVGTDILCHSQCTGTATVTPGGGTPAVGGYLIAWYNANTNAQIGQTTLTATALCAGDYYAVVTDDNGCDDTTDVITIVEPDEIHIPATFVDISCFGECDGSIDANAVGGTGALNVTWFDCNTNNPIGQAGNTASSLCDGSYFAEVMDDNGCIVNSSDSCIVITEPADITVTVPTTTDATCGGACDGSANSLVVGGAGGETVQWFDCNTDALIGTGANFTTFCTGSYYAVATDVNGCDDTSACFDINDAVLVTGNIASTDIDCFGQCTGTAAATPSGGVAPYTYEWINITTGTTITNGPSDNVTGLCAGDYTVQVFDVNLCASPPIPFTINENPAITVSATTVDANCNGVCDGSAALTVNGGVPNYTYVWTPNPGLGQGTDNVSGLCSGSYQVHIEDNLNCPFDTTITINEPSGFTLTSAFTEETCFGDCDGTANVDNITGGDGNYSFVWSGNGTITNGQGTNAASGLCPGNYQVIVSDGVGCDTTVSFVIAPAIEIIPTITVVADNNCNGDCSGVLQVSATGGDNNFSFVWGPGIITGQGTPTVTNLCAGNYTVDVTDGLGCTVQANETISEPTPYDITLVTTDVICNGDCDGTATVNVLSGGTPGYNFQWNDPFNQTVPNPSLCAGTWNVTISDLNGCDSIMPVVINEPQPLTITVNSSGNTCFGTCQGQGTAVVAGGTGNLNVEWFEVATNNSVGNGLNLTGLCSGDFYAVVTDDNGCTATSTQFNISETTPIAATVATTISNCVLCDGTAILSPTGGSGTFVNFTWSPAPGAGQGTSNATNMCAGVYSIIVEDSDGCTETISATVSDVNAEVITMDSTNVECFGDCDGEATANVICSDPVCSFQWFDDNGTPLGGETNPNITGLCAGTYIVEVTNGSGCVSTESVTLTEGNEILANSSFTEPDCNGAATGTAAVSPTGGAGGFNFVWTPAPLGGQGTNAATGLDAASSPWSVLITDAIGCSTTETFNLTDPPLLDVTNITPTDITCFGFNDGSALVLATGGVGNLSYQWFDCVTNNAIGQTGPQATGLSSGSYYVVVTDQSGCSQTSVCVDVVEPAQLSGVLSSNDVTCFGACNGDASVAPVGGINNYNYQWLNGTTPIAGGTGSSVAGLCPGTYSVDITDLNGCTENINQVVITQPTQFDISVATIDLNCSGLCTGTATITVNDATPNYTYTWLPAPGVGDGTPNGSQMCAGDYDVTITDAAGCDTTITITINDAIPMLSGATETDIICNGANNGSIITNVTGGVGPYVYNWLPGGETTPDLTGLAPGLYTLNVQDQQGCIYTEDFTITEPALITATTTSNNSTCGDQNGSASINATGGDNNFTYNWTNLPGGAIGQGTNSVTGLNAGIYTVIVTDGNGCSQTFTATVSDIGAEVVTIINVNDASCFDVADGSATADFVCSDPNCSVQWFDANTGVAIGQTNAIATGLITGDYFVQVTNNSGCITIEPVTINSPDDIIANETITPLVCNGDSNGQIQLAVTGGDGNYSYNWNPVPSNGNGTDLATGLAAGFHEVIITDGIGCDDTLNVEILDPTPITAVFSSTDVTCNGLTDGSAVAVLNGGNFPYNPQWMEADMVTPIAGETNLTISGLAAGQYYLQVIDQTNCTQILGPVDIQEPAILASTISGTDLLCNAACDGTATVSITGGTLPYTVNWFDAGSGTLIGQNDTTAVNLCAGDYFATISDNNGCSINSATQTLTEPTLLTVSVVGTDLSCNGACDGTATATPTGGTGNIQFTWTNSAGQPVSGGSGANVNSLCADTYSVVVTDDNGCQAGPESVTVSEPTEITITLFVNEASCAQSDGSATATPAGGNPNYNVQWMDATMTPLAGETNLTLSNIPAGNFFVEVTDNSGCSEIFPVSVSNVDGPIITINSTTDVSCFGGTDGSADISATGINPIASYIWNPSGQVGEDLIGVAAGTYTVQVTDNSGCITFETITINDAPEVIANFVATDATCGLCDGELVVNASGGTGNLSFDWSTGQTGSTQTGLCPGTYSVDITDDNGCLVNVTAGISNILGPTGETIVANEPTCNGGSNGDITVTPIGGTPPYQFLWIHDNGNTSSAVGLSAGTYYLQISDDNGCIRNIEIDLGEPDAITDISLITGTACGACNGEITVTADGGIAPYSYTWSHGPTNPTILSLCEGVYLLEIEDDNGCIEDFIYPINGANAPTLTLSATDEDCIGSCNGIITSDTTGGLAPMNYVWLDDQNNPIGQTSTDASGLCSGTYILQVIDGNGCNAFATADIGGPQGFQFSVPTTIDASCFGLCDGIANSIVVGGTLPYTFNWNNTPANGQGFNQATGLCAGQQIVTVTDANNCIASDTMTISEPTQIIIAVDSIQDALCLNTDDGSIDVTVTGGTPTYTYDWVSVPSGYSATHEDIDSLYAQDYILTATDLNGCNAIDTISVDTLIVVLAFAGNDTTICPNQAINFTGFGTGSTNLTYMWLDTASNVLSTDSLLTVTHQPGIYSYIFSANDGTCQHEDTLTLTVLPHPIVDAGDDVDIFEGQDYVLGGTETGPIGSTYAWGPNYFVNDTTIANPTAEPDTTTSYIVYVTDADGCTNSDTITISVFPEIDFPNGFSPNGDGVNEVWEIGFIEEFPESVVEIYNRWGDLLFRSVGYVEKWDGTFNGKALPVGTYYYVINLNNDFYPEPFTGPITILR